MTTTKNDDSKLSCSSSITLQYCCADRSFVVRLAFLLATAYANQSGLDSILTTHFALSERYRLEFPLPHSNTLHWDKSNDSR